MVRRLRVVANRDLGFLRTCDIWRVNGMCGCQGRKIDDTSSVGYQKDEIFRKKLYAEHLLNSTSDVLLAVAFLEH